MKRGWLIAIYCIIVATGCIDACGITTHTEIAHRAAHNYEYLLHNTTSIKQIIQKYQSAFQAGNPYPDSFYADVCKKGTLHDVSEDTHWVPFLNATIRYIQKKYTPPYNEEALRLIAFTLGYVSHQMADVTWHSLGLDQGFIQAMSRVNFHDHFGEAHSAADVGGDVVNVFELSLKYISDVGDWYVPYDDLYNIYMEYYGQERINKSAIIECSTLMFLGRLGEHLVFNLLYPEYYNKSMFLTDRLNDYFLGGMEDMATWTQISWSKVLYMLENGVDKCKLDHSIMFVDCDHTEGKTMNAKSGSMRSGVKTNEVKRNQLSNLLETLKLDESLIDANLTANGALILKPSSKFADYKLKYSEYAKNLNHIANSDQKSPTPSSVSVKANSNSYYLLNDYSYLGWSLQSADLNKDGSDDVITSAPTYSQLNALQNGAVFIKFARNDTGKLPSENLDLEKQADIMLTPPAGTVSSRFGHAVVVIDINQDGFSDLVVSAPSYGLQDIKYQGEVYVYLGNQYSNFSSEPSFRITCKSVRYCNLGWSLIKGDVNSDGNDDLIISSPYANSCSEQCGLVAVLLSRKTAPSSDIDLQNLDWILTGQMKYEWFGFSVKVKHNMLIVGAPQSRICYLPSCDFSDNDIQSVGRVYVYRYSKSSKQVQFELAPVPALLNLTGSEENEQFGYDLDLTKRKDLGLVLAISSVGKKAKLNDKKAAFDLHRAGQVQIYTLQIESMSASLITVLKSDRPYASFGSKVQFYSKSKPESEDLFIAASKRSSSIILVDQIEEGIIYMFDTSKKFPVGNFTDSCAALDLTPCPGRQASKVFELKETRAKFGFEFAFLKSTKSETTTLTGSSINYDNKSSRLSGKISFFEF